MKLLNNHIALNRSFGFSTLGIWTQGLSCDTINFNLLLIFLLSWVPDGYLPCFYKTQCAWCIEVLQSYTPFHPLFQLTLRVWKSINLALSVIWLYAYAGRKVLTITDFKRDCFAFVLVVYLAKNVALLFIRYWFLFMYLWRSKSWKSSRIIFDMKIIFSLVPVHLCQDEHDRIYLINWKINDVSFLIFLYGTSINIWFWF